MIENDAKLHALVYFKHTGTNQIHYDTSPLAIQNGLPFKYVHKVFNRILSKYNQPQITVSTTIICYFC